ncbi:MAG: hypothetical protein J0L53_09570 [Spirochaetes bacterium]|nr:hypothetical protein [Spirochaetota bacterium]
MICITLGFGCQSASTTNYAEKENRIDYNIDAAGESYAVSLFPKIYGAVAGPSFSLVLVSPVLVADAALYNPGSASLIPWFNARGIAVWLVRIPPQIPLERFGNDVLPQVAAAIRKNSTESDWVMGGISLGGQAIAHYLNDAPKHATVTGMQVKAAFFLGTPFDYEYPGSFGHRLAKENLSANDLAARFLPRLRADLIVSRANLLTAGRPVWRDSLTNVSLSGKGVRTLFIAGKIDNVAPSESVYKFFAKTIGDETKNSPDVRFLQPGRMNRHARDYDHSMMIASEELAAEILPDILKWLDL